MLQNPSKYHANPLSHFLALHNSQVANNGANINVMPSVTALGQSQYQHHNHHHHHNHHQLRQTVAAMSSHTTHQLQQQHQQQLSSHLSTQTHNIDDSNTSLDVGKSFTIAAILGLQKSAIEENRKDYNNVINLSMHGDGNTYNNDNFINNNNNNNNNGNLNNNNNISNSNNHNNNNNNNNSSNNNASEKTNTCNNFHSHFVNSFNCDNNTSLANRYVASANTPTPAIPSSTFGSTVSVHQQQSLATTHLRANTFAAAVAVAAAANASTNAVGGPSALQSLQQLHQHHAQQASLNFQREKLKSDNKKLSLKNKRVRTIFTPEQLERLESEFERQQYMVGPERLYLAHTLQLTEAQVKVWFQNRRIKWRKHHLELTQQRLALLRQGQLPGTSIAEDNVLPITRASSVSCDDVEDIKNEDRQLADSQAGSESELSVCNDSIDGESVIDGSEDT